MEYFHMGIFVILGGYLFKENRCYTTAFFLVFKCSPGYRESVLLGILFQRLINDLEQ